VSPQDTVSPQNTSSLKELEVMDIRGFEYFVITGQQIADISTILRVLAPRYADPAVRELEGLTRISTYEVK
jgi:hypothetical protein